MVEPFLSIVVIVAIVVTARTIRGYIAYRAQIHELQIAQNENNSDVLSTHVKQLESRIEVLEKLVTDQGYELDKKIRAL
ncbi:hypothetical protein G5S52_09135 [Grimontia sp. S25]|uniref:Phage shock protein B n=1 Tax=Grimontia sedimenti TaxID=2711294 RepID=A0A6M1REE1_9GAMM|nr:hypothetical protein [Grimontia sedimenti]NGN97822.1 hypothetical protein [Grimontia sedimenti]